MIAVGAQKNVLGNMSHSVMMERNGKRELSMSK